MQENDDKVPVFFYIFVENHSKNASTYTYLYVLLSSFGYIFPVASTFSTYSLDQAPLSGIINEQNYIINYN